MQQLMQYYNDNATTWRNMWCIIFFTFAYYQSF